MKKIFLRLLILSGLILNSPFSNLFAQSNSQGFLNQLFTEQLMTVTKEGDGVYPGTLRTVLMQAMGVRQNNPFTLITVNFDPSVKKIRIIKGNLPPIEKGFITIDCSNRVIVDGSQIDPSFLDPGEKPRGFYFQSSGNIVKNCRFVGFKGPAVVIAGNQNQIRENIFGELIKVSNLSSNNPNEAINNEPFISLSEKSSENLVESNEFIQNKKEAILFNAEAGGGNRIVGNNFIISSPKIIQTNQNGYRTSKVPIRSIVKEGDSYLISGSLSDAAEIEVLMNYVNQNKERRLSVIIPAISLRKGDFSLSVKNKGFIPGVTQLSILATSVGRNTSELSDPTMIPVEAPKVVIPEPAPMKEIPKEEKKTMISNTAKPINEGSDSAFNTGGVAPSPENALTTEESILHPEIPIPLPSSNKPGEPTVNLSSNPKRSGGLDAVKTDSLDESPSQ